MAKTNRWAAAQALGVAFALCGCGTAGELGNGTFWYECTAASDDDVACQTVFSKGSLPDPIGVGAGFVVSFSPHADELEAGESEGDIRVLAASPSRAAQNGLAFTLLDEGQSSLLAQGPSGTIIDYVHVNGRHVDRLEVLSSTGTEIDPLVLAEDETAWLIAAPTTPSGVQLAGRFTYQWASADPTVASLEPGAYSRRTGVRGVAVGTTAVEVRVGDVTHVITVQVEAQP